MSRRRPTRVSSGQRPRLSLATRYDIVWALPLKRTAVSPTLPEMPKLTAAAIAEQIKPGKFTQQAQDKLERTRANIEPQLIQLLRHRDAFVREIAATILGQRGKRESIPALIKAVSDRSEHVAFDAIVAIEKCAGIEAGALVDALFLDLSNPRAGARRLAAWYKLVRNDPFF